MKVLPLPADAIEQVKSYLYNLQNGLTQALEK